MGNKVIAVFDGWGDGEPRFRLRYQDVKAGTELFAITADQQAAGSFEAERAAFVADYRERHDIPEFVPDDMIWQMGKVEDQWEGWQARAALDSRAQPAQAVAAELPMNVDDLDFEDVRGLADVHADDTDENGNRTFDRGGILQFAKDLITRYQGGPTARVVHPKNEGIWSWDKRVEAAEQLLRPCMDADAEKLLGDYSAQTVIGRVASLIWRAQCDAIRQAPEGEVGCLCQCADSRPASGVADRDAALEEAVEAVLYMTEVPGGLMGSPCHDMQRRANLGVRIAAAIRELKSQPAATLAASAALPAADEQPAEPGQCWSVDEENFHYGSLSELLASHDDLQPGATVYVGDAIEPNIKTLCDADDVVDTIANRAYDMASDYAEDCADVSDTAKAELNKLLAGWIKANCNLNFYTVENVKPYVLTEADIAAAPTNEKG